MIISAIAAISRNRCIGKNNDIPWNVPADMRYFMRTTKGHHIITGRKNYEAMGKLSRRTNIIVTRQTKYDASGCVVVGSIHEGLALAEYNGETEAFIIGGGQIYKMALEENLIHRLYLTELDLFVDQCEVFFPTIKEEDWKIISKTEGTIDEKNTIAQTYFVYEKRNLK